MKKPLIIASLLIVIPVALICCIWGFYKAKYKINDYKIEKIISEQKAEQICFTSSYSIRQKDNKVVVMLDNQEWDISNFRKYGMGDDGEFIAVVIDANNSIQNVFSVIHTTAKKYMPTNKNCMELS